MTISKLDGRWSASRARLNVETLEGREAPGGWGGWDWTWSWARQPKSSHSCDSSCSRRGDQDCGDWNRTCSPATDRSCQDSSGHSSHSSCKPTSPPPTCQPPVTATSQIGGIVYVDSNLDATYTDGEPLLPGVPVTLTGSSASGAAINLSTTTDANGAYTFGSLPAGNFNISVTTPDGYVSGHSQAGNFGGTPGENTVTNIAVVAGQSSSGYNFGMEVPVPH
jgi:hypothetical protein